MSVALGVGVVSVLPPNEFPLLPSSRPSGSIMRMKDFSFDDITI